MICILLRSSLKQTSSHTAVNICSFYMKVRCSEGDDGIGRFYLRSPHTHSAGSDPDTALWNLWWIHRWNHGWWKGDKKRHHSLDWWKIKAHNHWCVLKKKSNYNLVVSKDSKIALSIRDEKKNFDKFLLCMCVHTLLCVSVTSHLCPSHTPPPWLS